MKTIARVLHGSHLFGTSTENSDTDFKSIVVPSVEHILLGNVNWSSNDGADSSRPNTKFDVDEESHDLLRFTRLLSQGQPVALEMLFAPKEFQLIEPDPAFALLLENREQIISRQNGKFLGYCRRQALAYGMKGERVEAAEKALQSITEILNEAGPREKIGPFIERIIADVGSEHVHAEGRTLASGRVIKHIRIASKMAAETVTLKEAQGIAQSVCNEYGKRSQAAKDANGKDWKALSHALRIGYEAVELFSTGFITLPRPEAAHLLQVKKGNVDADEVGSEIVDLLAEVEFASANSVLPEEANLQLLDDIVLEAYKDEVIYGKIEMSSEPEAPSFCA